MTAAQTPAAPPPSVGLKSPCIGVCRMQVATGLCEGCQRTLDEIAAWSSLDDEGRHVVMRLVRARRVAARGVTVGP